MAECFKEQKYKNLKANHNNSLRNCTPSPMFQRAKVQKLKANHHTNCHIYAFPRKGAKSFHFAEKGRFWGVFWGFWRVFGGCNLKSFQIISLYMGINTSMRTRFYEYVDSCARVCGLVLTKIGDFLAKKGLFLDKKKNRRRFLHGDSNKQTTSIYKH